MENEGIWSETFIIKAFMVDQNRKLRLPMLCNLLQEVAGNHADFRQLGFFEMQAQNRFWVLNRLKVEMYQPINWKEKIEIKTWISLMRGPFSHRNFSVLNTEGEEVAAAFTLWVALDKDSRKPVRIDAEGIPVFDGKVATCGSSAKIPAIENSEATYFHHVRNSDLDMIGHVNNVKYIEWVLDTYKNVAALQNFKSLEVNYLSETGGSEQVKILKHETHDFDFFSLRVDKPGKEVCRLQFYKV